MKSLKQKAISGIIWNFLGGGIYQIINFVGGIILARILDPEEFGLIGMVTIFIALSQSFVDSGFSQALIRKRDCTQVDYSTVFYFNLIMGLVLYLTLFFSSSAIARFYNTPILENIIKVLGLILIVNAFKLIQSTILIKRVDFKHQTKAIIISAIISFAVAIILAIKGYGVWSLVFKTLVSNIIIAILFWIYTRWKPSKKISRDSLKDLFGFGSNLLVASCIRNVYEKIIYVFIGKYFSASTLGFYTKSESFKNLPARSINKIIQKVTFPITAEIQDNSDDLRRAYSKIFSMTMIILFPMILGLASIAKPMIITLLGEKWHSSIIYLQLLCIAGMFYPLISLNITIAKIKKCSRFILKIELLKLVLVIPVLMIGFIFGINEMIISFALLNIAIFFIMGYKTNKLIGYNAWNQIKDVYKSLLTSIFMAVSVYSITSYIKIDSVYELIIGIISGIVITHITYSLLFLKDYFEIINILKTKIKIKK